jgi:hypothetical protein
MDLYEAISVALEALDESLRRIPSLYTRSEDTARRDELRRAKEALAEHQRSLVPLND